MPQALAGKAALAHIRNRFPDLINFKAGCFKGEYVRSLGTKDCAEAKRKAHRLASMAALSQAQAESQKEAQRAGIDHAKANNAKAYLGRKPSFEREQLELVKEMLAREVGTSTIAREAGLSRQTVLRIKDDPAAAEQVLASWKAREGEKRKTA
ncbi:recombinase [Nitrobacter sp. Nb-311A]|nr:recombinase [Nitrobacter sp. Nb-311A]